MDLHAQAMNGRLPYRIVSVGWGYWEGIGIGTVLLPKMMETVGEDVAARTETLLMTGVNPATEIIKLTEQRDYDMVVIGNRGLVGLKEYMGSVSHKVLNGTSLPVLIAR